jgi:hypothetical protein
MTKDSRPRPVKRSEIALSAGPIVSWRGADLLGGASGADRLY